MLQDYRAKMELSNLLFRRAADYLSDRPLTETEIQEVI